MIYHFILLIFILISLTLIVLIMFNPINNNSYYYSNYNNQFDILKFIYYDSFLNFLTKILIIVFFILSIIICMLNTHQIIHEI